MSSIFHKHITKNKFNIFSILLFLTIFNKEGGVHCADITVGTSVIPNECSTLGSNNPLRLLDCSIFKLSKGQCCMLTITISTTIEEDGVQQIVETYQTACIILEKYDAAIVKQATNEYKKLGGDVLIECGQSYLSILYIYLILFSILIFF